VDSHGLAPYIDGLRALEASISYPIADGQDAFCIDHGAAYHPFFSEMGKARFLIALQGATVIGAMVGVWREAELGGRRYTGLYVCDLKLAREWRGSGLVRRMLWHVLLRWPLRRDFQGWSFVFFAAMRGEKGDVVRSFRGWHLGRLLRPISRLSVYFVKLSQLCKLTGDAPSAVGGRGLNLSPGNDREWQSTEGRKDFVLRSNGLPWRLVHMPMVPGKTPGWARYLSTTAASLPAEQAEALACFAIDEKQAEQRAWLGGQGIEPGATCLVYGFSLPFSGPRLRELAWTHLATSEI